LAKSAEIIDPLLWRDAQHMLARHNRPDNNYKCAWCAQSWPCEPRRLAERAAAASRRPWREGFTARHDINNLRSLPRWRTELSAR
jgi:hypothetical protein